MILISYTVDDKQAQEFFDYAGYKSRDMREPFESVLQFVRMFEAAVFESEGEVLGERWLELSEPYRTTKEEEFGPKPILRATDDLWFKALTEGKATVDGVEYHVDAISERGFDYGEAHMHGTSRMVPRPWFAWTREHDEYTELVFERWLDDLRSANQRRSGPEASLRPEAPNLGHIYEGLVQ